MVFFTHNSTLIDQYLKYDNDAHMIIKVYVGMMILTLLLSSYPVYYWNKSASVIGGLTGPYLIYIYRSMHGQYDSLTTYSTHNASAYLIVSLAYTGIVLLCTDLNNRHKHTILSNLVCYNLPILSSLLLAYLSREYL